MAGAGGEFDVGVTASHAYRRRSAADPSTAELSLGVHPPTRGGSGLAQPTGKGVARNEATFAPEPYMNSVPDELHGRPVLVLDPMLATGGSMEHSCRILAQHGAGALTAVCVLAAPEGIARLEASRLVAHVVTASIDERLNDQAYIIPGLGDAGDRLFGTA